MIWLILGIAFFVFMIYIAVVEDETELIVGGFMGFIAIFVGMNSIFAGTMDQDRTYELKSLTAIDGTGSLVQIDDSECYYNNGSGIQSVDRAKCEIVESTRGEMKTTHYSPNKTWTLFEWTDYNRFYVTREQVSYGS